MKKGNDKVKELLNRRLRFDIEEAEEQKAEYLEFDHTDFSKKEKDDYLLQARAPVIKQHMAALKEQENYLLKYYKRELNFSKEFIYPRLWMLNDKRISKTLDRCTKIIPILNYIYNLNRRKGSKYWKMDDLIAKATNKSGQSSTYNGNNLAVFVTDKEFYEELMEKLNCSRVLIEKHLKVFAAESIIVNLGNAGNTGTLYADGYYTEYANRRRKHPFLTQAKHKDALREFTLAQVQPK